MGNILCATISKDIEHEYLKSRRLFIDPIDLLEFFPMLIKNKLSVTGTINELSLCLYFNEYFTNAGYVKGGTNSVAHLKDKSSSLTTIIEDEDNIRRIKEERLYSAQLSQIFLHIKDNNITIPKDIYGFVSLATKLNIIGGIIDKIIYHEDVDLLLAAVHSKKLSLIKGCVRINDPRSNDASIYHKCKELGDEQITNLVTKEIITKNLLVKEVFGLFSPDVYNYVSSRGMLYL